MRIQSIVPLQCIAPILVLIASIPAAVQAEESHLYLGQKPPGITPEIFAPGVISLEDEYEFSSVFSADGKEFYYGVDTGGSAEIRYTRLGEDGTWSKPALLLLNEPYSHNDPFFSPDEQRLYFISNRPMNGRGEPKDVDIWYVKRRGEGWSEPINVGPPINSPADEYYISFTDEGTFYFASNLRAKKDEEHDHDIYAAEPKGDGYAEPVRLGSGVNTGGYEADAFVAYDGSYLVFGAGKKSGFGRGDLYISYRQEDGTWSKAKNLGEKINTKGHELCPFVTKDGKYFFYTSNKNIVWVSAEVLSQEQVVDSTE